MLNKQQLKETLERFPEEFLLEDLIDELILLDKIDKAENQSELGEVLTERNLQKEMKRWS